MKFQIPYGKQFISQKDKEAVVKALEHPYLTQGPKIKEFESAFSQYIQSPYSVAVSNGTAALHLAVLALGLKPGQKVITSPITFSASANCIRYAGGEVVFADIDPETYLIDLNEIEKLLKSDEQIVGIIPVDFAGRVVNTEKLRGIADQHNCWILEDACHAPGGYFINSEGKQIMAGSCKYVDAAIFSFHPVKHIACGEGGMVTCKLESTFQTLLTLRTHGIVKNDKTYTNSIGFAELLAEGSSSTSYPGWYMEMQELGFNYRLTDFQAALGLSQLEKANEGIKKRREIADYYFNSLNTNKIKGQSCYIKGHAYHLYVLEVENRREIYEQLKDKGVYCQIHYIPVHLMPYYQELGWKVGDFPFAENYYKHCISIPMYPTLQQQEIDYVINSINSL